MKNSFGSIFQDQVVFLTGHTGFKGSWLSLWLQELGAKVVGYSLNPPTAPNLFSLAHVDRGMVHLYGDICNYQSLKKAMDHYRPTLVFHLAAQPIVLDSLISPKETFEVNSGGTINVLEAIRHSSYVQAAVMVTSDKCYENKEWVWGYRENDALGGKDPYSASKSMAEMAIASYKACFPNLAPIASVRSGNVIGGGDFSNKRLIPDCMQALMDGKLIPVRNPKSTRPWLHLFDPLRGYLTLAARLLTDKEAFSGPWNFGPLESQSIDVQTLVETIIDRWGRGDWIEEAPCTQHQETKLLRVNWDKACHYLGWKPLYQWQEAVADTVDWFVSYNQYRNAPQSIDLHQLCLKHLYRYADQAKKGIFEHAVSSLAN